MKKTLTLIILLLTTHLVICQTIWTVKSVPNTRLQGNSIHVSDPDGYLSDSAEMAINTALSGIRDQADVFLVTLTSIGDDDPKQFATTLFNYWGIGDADTNNGVLLLFVEDQHALEFETGYGAETTLTDARCSQIFRNTIVPYFREEDYENGLCAGIGDIVTTFGGTVPMGLMTAQRYYDEEYDYDSDEFFEDDGADDDILSALIIWFFILVMLPIPFISCVRGLIKVLNKKSGPEVDKDNYNIKNTGGINYITNYKNDFNGKVWESSGCLMSLVYGISLPILYIVAMAVLGYFNPDMSETAQGNWAIPITLVVYLTMICIIQNHRALKQANKRAETSSRPKKIYQIAKKDPKTKLTRILAPWLGWIYAKQFDRHISESSAFQCPTCGKPLEDNESLHLPETCYCEEKLGVYKYSPYRCASGHVFVLRENGPHYNKYTLCEDCHARVNKKISEKIITNATYKSDGQKKTQYRCEFCGKEQERSETIPKLVYSYYSGGSGSSHYHSSGSHYHSSSHHSRGSFGGGRSGGGGHSGRW